MTRKLLPLAVGLALSRAAFAQGQPPADPQNPPPPDPAVPVTYVGSNLRVSLGVDDSGDVLGEVLGILGKTDDHAWLGELWLARRNTAQSVAGVVLLFDLRSPIRDEVLALWKHERVGRTH